MKKLLTKLCLLGVLCLVGSNAWAEVQNFTIDLSKFDKGLTYDSETKTASITIGNKQWSKLDLKDYLDQIEGNITNIKITLTENIGDNGSRMALGLYDYNKTSWATNAYQDTEKSVSVWGVMGGNNATRIYYNATYLGSGITVGSDAVIEVDMNFSTKKFTLKDNGTTRINSQNFVNTDIDLIRWFALYSWSTNTTTIKNMSMEVTYTAIRRTVTFSETNDREYSISVKDALGNTIDAESDGSYSLIQGKTYTYTATPSDVMEYGVISNSFTVGAENINVPLTFAAITLPEFALPAKALYSKATVPSGTRQTTGIARTAASTTGVGGPTNNGWTWSVGNGFTWYASFDVYRADADASVNMKMYTNKGGESTSFQFDNQGVRFWTGRDASYITNTALEPGKWYRVEVVSDLVSNLAAGGNTMTVTIKDIAADVQFATKTNIGFRNGNCQWFLPTIDQVTNTILTNWYSYYIADEVTKFLGTTGFGTFSAAYNVIVPAGVVVYNSELNGETLTATPNAEATVIPANTGVIFKGTPSADVTFVATADAASDVTTALTAAPNGVDGDSETIFGLLKNENTFAKVMSGVTLANNSAYLSIPESTAAVRFVIGGEATAISEVNAAETVPVKSIMNGRVVIVKNGKMFNAAGALLK